MFYSLLNIVVVNSFLLSYYISITKKNKFSKYKVFRKTLCKGLFIYIRSQSIVPIADIVITAYVVAIVGTVYTASTRVEH